MNGIVLGGGGTLVEFGLAEWNPSGDPYAGDRFDVRLQADDLVVHRSVFMFRHDWAALTAFFADLASCWRGWAGAKTWESVEHDLEISVTANARGNCTFDFVVRKGPVSSWLVRLEGIIVDAGEDMSALARRIEVWAQGPPDGEISAGMRQP